MNLSTQLRHHARALRAIADVIERLARDPVDPIALHGAPTDVIGAVATWTSFSWKSRVPFGGFVRINMRRTYPGAGELVGYSASGQSTREFQRNDVDGMVAFVRAHVGNPDSQ